MTYIHMGPQVIDFLLVFFSFLYLRISIKDYLHPAHLCEIQCRVWPPQPMLPAFPAPAIRLNCCEGPMRKFGIFGDLAASCGPDAPVLSWRTDRSIAFTEAPVPPSEQLDVRPTPTTPSRPSEGKHDVPDRALCSIWAQTCSIFANFSSILRNPGIGSHLPLPISCALLSLCPTTAASGDAAASSSAPTGHVGQSY